MADPYISEINYFGSTGTDLIEIAVDAGYDVSSIEVVVYRPSGAVESTHSVSTLAGSMAGKDIYTLTNVFANGEGLHKNGAIALVVDGEVIQFISFDKTLVADDGPAEGMTSTQVGSVGNDKDAALVTANDGSSYYVQATSDPGVIPCFVQGTLIATPRGAVRVDDLRAGQLVETPDGPQRLRWIGRTPVRAIRDEALPVRLPAGCLGKGQPQTDLRVSQNHRISLEGYDCELLFGTDQVLVAAKHLVGQYGIELDREWVRPVYYHLLFDRHELVWSNGLLTESFHPGDVIMDGSAETLAELHTLFPDATALRARRTNSTCLRAYEAHLLIGQRAAAA